MVVKTKLAGILFETQGGVTVRANTGYLQRYLLLPVEQLLVSLPFCSAVQIILRQLCIVDLDFVKATVTNQCNHTIMCFLTHENTPYIEKT